MKSANIVLFLCLLVSICFNVHLLTKEPYIEADITKTTYTDTILYYKPVPKDSVILKYVSVKLPTSVPKTRDSLGNLPESVPDSMNVDIPITQNVYKDSTYTAYISGYRAQLDSLIFQREHEETTIIKWKKPKRWNVGIHAGCGATPNGLEPYIGIGVSYNLFSF